MSSSVYLLDCRICGAQFWIRDEVTGTRVRVECVECGVPQSLALTADGVGDECRICENDHWRLFEETPALLVLECTECGDVAELWCDGRQCFSMESQL